MSAGKGVESAYHVSGRGKTVKEDLLESAGKAIQVFEEPSLASWSTASLRFIPSNAKDDALKQSIQLLTKRDQNVCNQ